MRQTLGLLSLALCLSSCGGGAAAPEPLVSTTLVGSFDGVQFTPVNGFATVYNGQSLIAVGAGPIHCGTESAASPPPGYNAVIVAPAFAVGTYGSVLVDIYKNVGSFEGVGANNGTLTITAVTPDTISGQITYNYTDGMGRSFTLTGTFEVIRCPT